MANEQNLNPFKKGQSGNPKGRPVGKKSRSTIAKKWLETPEKFKNPITGEIEELTQEDIGTLALIKKMRSGDVRAYDSLMIQHLERHYKLMTSTLTKTVHYLWNEAKKNYSIL